MILFLSYLVKNYNYRVSVICKLAMKWYLMYTVPAHSVPFIGILQQPIFNTDF